MKKLLWMGCLSYLVIGIAHVVGGALLEQLIAYYGITYKDGGQWIMNQFIGFLFGVLLAPALTSRVGKRGAVLIAMALLTLSEAAYSLLLPWGWMLAIAPIAGIGFGMTEAIVGATIIDHMKGKASAMSRLETFFGIGALLIPVTAALLIQQHVWQLSFPILSAMAGITFVLWLTMSFGSLDDSLSPPQRSVPEREGGLQQAAALSKNRTHAGRLGYAPRSIPFLALSAAFFMIYVGMEMSFSNYLPSILISQTGMSDSTATAALSLFWGTMVLGRLFAGIMADRIGYANYLFITTAAAAVVFIGMIVFQQQSLLLILIALSGLCFSGVFGIALVYANGMLPGMTERTTSLLVALGGVGGAVFPRLTGWFMDRYSTGTTLYYFSALVVALLAVLLVLIMTGRKQSNRMNEKEVAPS
ncbi:MFS transporter [Paenibacillus sp. 1011MAR3C5]|uniref:MFS transporter n=1 Tax=Paenibacillus sp. 1011MAR3C5 TaxID=1675787 RepID=UPI000E6C427A|nr:MFS transporter [Paenibacillus sp. 1011MAR3C5]RJE85541.1 MFS transporter [Paenibacillus sp. 1011MAR3C5]